MGIVTGVLVLHALATRKQHAGAASIQNPGVCAERRKRRGSDLLGMVRCIVGMADRRIDAAAIPPHHGVDIAKPE